MDDELREASSMVVSGNKVVAISENNKPVGEFAEEIDLEGKTVVPGFNDSHMHLLGVGESMETINLNSCKSRKDVVETIEEYIDKNNPEPGSWLEGRGWDQNRFNDKTMPGRELLDRVKGDYPIYLKRVCGHISTANSMALKKAGIKENTSAPSGGNIDINKEGQPTGILRENAMKLVEQHIPQPDIADFKRWILSAGRELVKNGITSVQTDDFGSKDRFEKIYPLYKDLADKEELPLRINLQTRIEELSEFKEVVENEGIKTGDGNSWLKVGPCKILADGSLGGRTAALCEPYSDQEETKGTLIYTPEELRKFIKYADSAGFQLAIHGIGDRVIELIVDLYREELEKKRIKNTRPRIIHAQITNQELIDQMAELGIGADIQPIFINSDLHIAEDRLGERVEGTYAWNTMWDKGINLAGGSDAPVETYSPLKGIYSAVTRKDLNGYPEKGWRSEEGLSIDQALSIYTKDSAYHTFEEDVKGRLAEGMLADFVVLDQDITAIDSENIKDLEIAATYIGGKKVY